MTRDPRPIAMPPPPLPESLLHLIRPAVRAQHPYIVGGATEHIPVKLNQNESPYDIPEAMKKSLLEAFFKIPFNRYPTEQPDPLRKALARHIGCTPDHLLIGNGSNELTHTLGLCLIERDAPVVLPAPMFSLYTSVVRLFAGRLITVPCRADLHFDVPALADAISNHRPVLTVLTTPNNPTGLAMKLRDIESLIECSNGYVVVDEAYVEFSEEESAYLLLKKYPNLILMRTFSKAFGLAGLRLGYMVAHPDVISEFLKARLPFMINRLAQTVALTLLDHADLVSKHVNALKQACRRLEQSLKAMDGVDVVAGQANFLLFKTPLKPENIMKNLSSQGVLVRNMSGYPELAGYLRVNAGSPEENKAFLNALEIALFSRDE